jgi:hypothetical protein
MRVKHLFGEEFSTIKKYVYTFLYNCQYTLHAPFNKVSYEFIIKVLQ